MTGEIHRIAIFEDNSVDRFIYERTLEHVPFAYDARVFQTPDEGLHSAHYLEFDVVIIHLNFWGTNYGFQIMNEMKKICRNNPVFIAVTSYLPEDEIEAITSKGFQSVYEKPFIFNHLEEILAQVTEKEFISAGRRLYSF
jgi:CheY-like chemotaxis protein